jgi:hypothetical protein
MYGTLMMRPPTTRPSNISTHTIRLPSKLSAVTFLPCNVLTPTYTIHPGIFCPLRGQDGCFVTCDMTSTLFKVSCDFLRNKLWAFCPMSPGYYWRYLGLVGMGGKNVPVVLRISLLSLLQSCNVLYSYPALYE